MNSFETIKNNYIQAYGAGEYEKAASLAWGMMQLNRLEGTKALLATDYQKHESSDGGYQIYALHETPSDCPWRLETGGDLIVYVQALFSPLAGELSSSIAHQTSCLKFIYKKIITCNSIMMLPNHKSIPL